MSLERQYARTLMTLSRRGRLLRVFWLFNGFVACWTSVTEHWGPRPDLRVSRLLSPVDYLRP